MYAKKIKDAGIQDRVYEENMKIGKIKFDYHQQPQGIQYVQNLASSMHMHSEENMNQIIRANFMHNNFDHDRLESIADMLLDPSKVNIMLRAKCLETDQTAKWYGTKYKISDISNELKERILNPDIKFKNKIIDLPPPNTLLPSEDV